MYDCRLRGGTVLCDEKWQRDPEMESVVANYGLPSSYWHSMISTAIQEQLNDYKAHSTMLADL